MNPEDRLGVDRRLFLRRILRAGALALGAGALGLAFWDRRGPVPQAGGSVATPLADYSVGAGAGKLAVVRGADRHSTIAASVAALGGMAAFVRPGDRVLLKVNAAFATPAMLGATSHPDAVARVIDLCLEAGASRVTVTDNPINDPRACFALSGIAAAVREAGGELVLPGTGQFESYSLSGGRLIRHWPVLAAPLRRADKVIGLAPVKDHHRSGASMTLKNWYGLLGGRRNMFHQQIHAIIAELALLVKPTLVILDGTVSMTANGPTGGSLEDLKPTQTVIAGVDPVAVDAFGATLLGKGVRDLPHLEMAQRAGAGTADISSLEIVQVTG